MAWDLCVGFSEKPLPHEFWTQQTILKDCPATTVYLFSGEGCPPTAGRPFFGFWADEWFDLGALCCEASRHFGRLCLAWKLEHSGCGGYQAFVDGQRTKEERSDNPDYVLLPAEGLEKTFRRLLAFQEDDDRVCFPEILLEDPKVPALRLDRQNGSLRWVTADDLPRDRLFHYGMDVEPVLPFHTFG